MKGDSNLRLEDAASIARRCALGALAVLVILSLAGGCSAEPDPQIGPAVGIGSVTVAAPFSQEAAAAAGNDGVFLVVWQDQRSQQDYDIYGAFVGLDGQPIGTESFLISKGVGGGALPEDQLYPAVAFNGTHFLVVWTDYRSGASSSHIYGTRVAPDGTVLDPGGLAISQTTGTVVQYRAAVASDGVDWEVVYEEYATSSNITGAKVLANGTVASRAGICMRAEDESDPSIAWNGSKYVMVWVDGRSSQATGDDIYACFINPNNTKSGSDILVSSNPSLHSSGAPKAQSQPSVAVGAGGTALVVWEDDRGSRSAIYGARINTSGTVLDAGGIAISTGSSDKIAPGLAWDGSTFVAAWRDAAFSRKIRAARINTSGGVLDPNGFPVSNTMADTRGACVAAVSGTCLVIYETTSLTDPDVLASTVVAGDAPHKDVLVSISVQDQPHFAAAFDGTNYVVVWSDRRYGKYAVFAARVATDGTVIDPGGVLITSSATDQVEPAIAWNGSHYLVVWVEGVGTAKNILGMRITRDLTRLDLSPLAICTAEDAQSEPAVAWNGSSFLVTWTDRRNLSLPPNYSVDVYGARVSPTGAVTPVTGAICNAAGDQRSTSITSDGSDFLVAWEDYRNYTPSIYCARVSSTGTVLNTNGVQVSSAGGMKTHPSVAYDGTNYFITWAGTQHDYVGDIYGVRMSKTLSRVDATDIRICSSAMTIQSSPVVCWTGSNYYVAWQDYRNAASDCDIYFKRLRADGTMIDANDLQLTGEWYPEVSPCIISGGNDWTMVLYASQICSLNRLTARTCGRPMPVAFDNIALAKARPDGFEVLLPKKIVTAGNDQLAGCFYVEDSDRRAGIRVVGGTGTISEGSVVDVAGVLETVDGERQINASSVIVSPTPGTVPAPFGLSIRSLGGGPLNQYTPGVYRGSGANNLGLFVKLWGRVVSSGSNHFYLDDNSLLLTPALTPIYAKVVCPEGVTPPEVGTSVMVTGISSCEPDGSVYVRRLLVRKVTDIVPFP